MSDSVERSGLKVGAGPVCTTQPTSGGGTTPSVYHTPHHTQTIHQPANHQGY